MFKKIICNFVLRFIGGNRKTLNRVGIILNFFIMAKGKGNDNNSANQQNANKGTSGTNKQYDQNQGNRGKQLNPNQKK